MFNDTTKKRTYDAIVIGSGASGGWAAKELCDKGLKTLVLERGRKVEHVKDYPTASKAPWDFKFRGNVPMDQRIGYESKKNFRAEYMHWNIKDDEQPIIQEKPFRWFRGYHTGGKSILWARQTQRWSDMDFEGPMRDGFAVDWPIRYKDIEPWYSYIEKFVGIAGSRDGLAELPDSEVMSPVPMSCVEEYFKQSLKENYGNGRHLIHARCAHITDPQPIHLQQGRSKCQNQNMCRRGCNFGGYFSSTSSTLPWALKTGNMTLRPDSIVHSIIYDEAKQKAVGVKVIERETNNIIEFFAEVIFVNASTINSTSILLNSKSDRFPNGLGNDNGLMGKYLSWHNYRGKANATYEGLKDMATLGRRPSNAYIPRFRNLKKQETDYLRGYAIGISGGRSRGPEDTDGIGESLTAKLLNPKYGDWHIASWMMGECVPMEQNHMRLHDELKDKYGIPQIILSCDWTDNDDKMVVDYVAQSIEMFEKAGFTNIDARDTNSPPGSDIHEMGGVRMGSDHKTSLTNKWNQLHHCKNVYVADGACMTSTGTQNPTLTFMALTARAVDHAVTQLKSGALI